MVADPDRLSTLMPALDGVTVVCWLMGSAGMPTCTARGWSRSWSTLVDTPVRGVVYEAAGSVEPALLSTAPRSCARRRGPGGSRRGRRHDPADHAAWLDAMAAAVERLLARERDAGGAVGARRRPATIEAAARITTSAIIAFQVDAAALAPSANVERGPRGRGAAERATGGEPSAAAELGRRAHARA